MEPQEITFSSMRPQRLLTNVAFYVEDYDERSREVTWEGPVFLRAAGEYIDNEFVKAIYGSFTRYLIPPSYSSERTRIVMRKRSSYLDVTQGFLTLKALIDRGDKVQVGLLSDLDGEDIDLADALVDQRNPDKDNSRDLVLQTTNFSDMRTRVRKNANIIFYIEVSVAGTVCLFARYALAIVKGADGSWTAITATEDKNPSLTRHNALHVEQFSQKLGISLSEAERILREHAHTSFSNLEQCRNTGEGDIPEVLAETILSGTVEASYRL